MLLHGSLSSTLATSFYDLGFPAVFMNTERLAMKIDCIMQVADVICLMYKALTQCLATQWRYCSFPAKHCVFFQFHLACSVHNIVGLGRLWLG